MDIKISFRYDFAAVFLINGQFFEGKTIEYDSQSVVYITVLPLEAQLLPYTVMMVGSTPKSNQAIADCYSLFDGNFCLSLKPRHNYVYSVENSFSPQGQPKDIVEKLFDLITRKKAAAARELLTTELSNSIDDSSLLSFFDGIKDIVHHQENLYFLIDEQNKGTLHSFIIKDNQIDNIVEVS